MSYEDAKKFLEKALFDPILRNKYILALFSDEMMSLAEHYGYSFTREELHAASHYNTKDLQIINIKVERRELVKLITCVDSILKNNEVRYHEMNPDSGIDVEFDLQLSDLANTLRNFLYALLKSKMGTKYKSEDFLDIFRDNFANQLYPSISLVPGKNAEPCHPELLVLCFDEDSLDVRFQQMIDQIEKCHLLNRTTIFLTSKWYPEAYAHHIEKINQLDRMGHHFIFIFFSLFGAT